MRTLSERLKWAREQAEISARALDELAGLTPGHTLSLETGRRASPALATVEALANVLGVSIDWLCSGKGKPPTARTLAAALEAAGFARTGTDS